MVLVWQITDDSPNSPNFPTIWYIVTALNQLQTYLFCGSLYLRHMYPIERTYMAAHNKKFYNYLFVYKNIRT